MRSTDYSRLVVRYPYQTDSEYAVAYHFAAEQLATTFAGDPIDDLILLPFLTLYRQAFELKLKIAIRSLVRIRINYREGHTPELANSQSEEHFKDDLGHNLFKLLNEVKRHFAALDLPEQFPKSLEAMVSKLHKADKAGTAFRYAGLLPETQDFVDFPSLVEMLNREFEVLCTVIDYADGCYEPMPTLDEIERESN